MIYLEKNSANPWFNQAAEEVALKSSAEDILMLWASEPSVVLGKHQNTMAEVNLPYVLENRIPVIRRISGGGTVFHDLGNLNYSVISTSENRERLVDFSQFTEPIIQFFKGFGQEVAFYGKTNLAVRGRKFSGTAAHVFKNRVLHHGTLLFSTDLAQLEQSIRPPDFEIQDKAVKSVRAEIVNINTFLPEIASIDEFHQLLKEFLFNYYSIHRSRTFTTKELGDIDLLMKDKYRTLDWNYGYSPSYQFSKTGPLGSDIGRLRLAVKKGIIVDLQLESTHLSEILIHHIQQKIIHLPHNPQAINDALQSMRSSFESERIDIVQLLNLLI